MLHSMIRTGALLGLGLFAAGSVNALGLGAKILADNEVSAWQLISHSTSSIVASANTPTAQLTTPAGLSFSNLDEGNYSLVFALTNWTSIHDHRPGPADTDPRVGNWVGFLANISPDADTVINGLTGNPLVSNMSWDSNLRNTIPTIDDAVAAPGSKGWSNTSEVIANNGEGIWADRSFFGHTGFPDEAKWIWADGDTDGQVLVRTQLQLSAVPIPAAGILFFSAIAGLITMGRRRNAASVA